MRVLLRLYQMALGDCVMFGIVLRHLRRFHPSWFIGVEALYGCHEVFLGLADAVHILRHPITWNSDDYDLQKDIIFRRPDDEKLRPSTKAAICLREEFGLEPCLDLFSYVVQPSQEEKADRFLAETGPYALVHYTGNSHQERKNLSERQAEQVCRSLMEDGLRPVILDMSYRSGLQDRLPVVRLDRRHPWLWDGERVCGAGLLRAMIDRAAVFIGIDSGPGHIAGASSTPSFIIWTGFSPVMHYDFAGNVVHVVPQHIGGEWFREHYRHEDYEDLDEWLSRKRFVAE